MFYKVLLLFIFIKFPMKKILKIFITPTQRFKLYETTLEFNNFSLEPPFKASRNSVVAMARMIACYPILQRLN